MAYEGDVLDSCGLFSIDLSQVSVVAVSGSGPNVCGHLILYSPANGGYYFHVAGGIYSYPRYMTDANYRRYLRENGKRELRRIPLRLPNPRDAEAYLERALSSEWLWAVLPHNCLSFCEGVIRAGGGTWTSYTNCPTLATDVPQHTISQFVRELEGQIYRSYGVPR